jgi:hypothetical protein
MARDADVPNRSDRSRALDVSDALVEGAVIRAM